MHRVGTRWRAVLPTIGIVAVLAGFGTWGFVLSVAPGASARVAVPANATSLVVSATGQFSFQPYAPEVGANATIYLTFNNLDGQDGHTFTLFDVEGYVLRSASQMNTWISENRTIVNIQLAPTSSSHASFPAPPTGWYEFVCTYHFALGMIGFVGFGVPVPGNISSGAAVTYAEWPIFVIGGTIVSLLIIAIVLGFVVGRRKGAQHEMPPERLGYPEAPPPPPRPLAPKPPTG